MVGTIAKLPGPRTAGSPFSRKARAGVVGRLMALSVALAASAAQAEMFDQAVERYRPTLVSDIDQALAGTRQLRDRIAAGDTTGARKAWIEARAGWERSEVFTAGFVPKLDEAIDAWPDATAGFHSIEAKLFSAEPSDITKETDALIVNLTDIDDQVRKIPLTPQGLYNGIARLAYEVGDSKVDGGESRFSGTSLDDMRNNVSGIELAYGTLFAATLEANEPKLAKRVRNEVDRLKILVAAKDLQSIDPHELRRASEMLVVSLQAAAPKLGLETPTLEETPK
jgi:iron uptake system component EfeO